MHIIKYIIYFVKLKISKNARIQAKNALQDYWFVLKFNSLLLKSSKFIRRNKMHTSISNEEYKRRIIGLQKKMAEQDLDAVICYGDEGVCANLRYLTTYWPLFEVGGALIGRTGNPLVLIGGEAPEFGGQTPFGMEAVRGCGDFGHTTGPVRDWVGVKYYSLEDLFDEVTGGKGVKRLGIADYVITPHRLYQRMQEACLPEAELIDCGDMLDEMRMNKSPAEIEMIHEACLVSEKAFSNALGMINPDMTEFELQGVLAAELHKNGGEGPSFPILCYSGYRSRSGIGRSTHNKLGTNNMINIDIGCHYAGYASAYNRPIVFGKMTDQMKEEIHFMLDLHETLITKWVKPGITAGAVYEKYYQTFIDHGYGPPPASASHGIGVFEGEPPTFRKNIPTILKAGMTVAGDHFFRSENYGFRIEDCYVITETGTELFTKSRWEYIEL
jgi:Xaa-Pro aminopeptidase